jgi:hypothetical protein
MAERIRVNLVLDYGVDYKTDSGIESDVRDALNTVGIHLHAMSRLQYKDGQAVVAAEVYPADEADEVETQTEAQLAVDNLTAAFRRDEAIAARNHPMNRNKAESAPVEEIEGEEGGEESSDEDE